MNDSTRRHFKGTKRFELQQLLGAGGFGEVYQVYDKERETIVALKTLRNTEASALYQFKQEFRAISGIVHPNLVTLYELLSDGEEWFFTMELVKGVDFLQYINKDKYLSSQVNIERIRLAVVQLAEGIYALHKAGKLHCDLKPSNVLVTEEGRVTILDFGLVTELKRKTIGEATLSYGTPEYIAPEVVAGLAPSEASDWYSLGVMFYEALTGELPFDSMFGDVLRDKQIYDSPPPSFIVPDLDPELDSLCQELLQRKPKRRPKGEEILGRLGAFSSSIQPKTLISSPRQNAFLIGREEHLAKLKNSFQSQSNATIAYVEGLSGMGKSVLINSFLNEVTEESPRVVILNGRCYEQESVPYKAFDSVIDNLAQYLNTLLPEELVTLIPSNSLALAKLFPVLRQVEGIAVAKKNLNIPDSQELRRRAFASLRQLFTELSSKYPVIIHIDDLQWGDLDSIFLLNELLRPPKAPSLLMIFSYRSDEIETSPFLKSLFASPIINLVNSQKIIVDVLSKEDAKRLVSLLFDKEVISNNRIETIIEESAGNPYFINELVHYAKENMTSGTYKRELIFSNFSPEQLVDDISMSVMRLEDVIYSRIAQLPLAARLLIDLMAVAGRPIERLTIKRAAELGKEEQAAIALLKTNNLIRVRGLEESDKVELYHDRIRETIIKKLSAEDLKSHHSKLALILESVADIDPEILLVHFQGAGNYKKAAEYAAKAADKAMETLAFDQAANFYRLAIDLQPEIRIGGLEKKLGVALTNAGRTIEAAQAYLLAAAEEEDSITVLTLKQVAAEQLLRGGHLDEGLSVLGDVLSALGMSLPKSPWHSLILFLFGRFRLWLQGLEVKERDPHTISQQELVKIDICWAVATGLAMVDTLKGSDFQVRHLLYALKAGDPYRLSRAFSWEITFSATFGSRGVERSKKFTQMAKALVDKLDNPQAEAHFLLMSGMSSFLQGSWLEAYQLCKQAAKILREQCSGVGWEIYTSEVFLMRALFFLGDLLTISERVIKILNDAQERGDLYAETSLRTRIAYMYYLIQDQVKLASNEIDIAIEKWSQTGFHAQHYYAFIARGDIALYNNQGDIAWKLVKESWPKMKRAMFFRVQFLLIEALYLASRSAMCLAIQTNNTKPLINIAERIAKRLDKENKVYADAYAALSRAMLALFSKSYDFAITQLSAAESKFISANMQIHSIVTRRAKGMLISGEEGLKLINEAEEKMRKQGIQNIKSFAQMLLPGNWEKS
ncbi:MAG: protein kinase [Acidobacteria bacterium]|nr:protein kinase [Acidobacteriota bacterium]